MQAKTIIAALQELDPETEVMAQWFTKEDVEADHEKTYTQEQWELAVRLFDKWPAPGSDDFGARVCLEEAAERLGGE